MDLREKMIVMLMRYGIIVAGVVTWFCFSMGIRLLWKKTCFFRHRNKKYLAMDYHGYKNAQGVLVPRCKCWKESYETYSDRHRFLMRWFCDSCGNMGEHCWDKTGEWTLEHGEIVPDEKRWAQRK